MLKVWCVEFVTFWCWYWCKRKSAEIRWLFHITNLDGCFILRWLFHITNLENHKSCDIATPGLRQFFTKQYLPIVYEGKGLCQRGYLIFHILDTTKAYAKFLTSIINSRTSISGIMYLMPHFTDLFIDGTTLTKVILPWKNRSPGEPNARFYKKVRGITFLYVSINIKHVRLVCVINIYNLI